MQVETIPSPPFDARRRRISSRWRHLLLVAASVGVVYVQTAGFDFVTYDDYDLVYHNQEFLSNPGNILTSFGTDVFTTHRPESVYYRPILLVSFIIDYQLWHLQPAAYHLVNVLLHALTAALLYLLMETLTSRPFLALAVGLLFALHPLQTESVGWVAGRNDLLMGLFIMSMMLFYLHARAPSPRRSLAGILSVISFALALFTKEAAAFYILLPPLFDLCTGDASLRNLFSARRGMIISGMIGVLVAYLFVRLGVFGAFIGAEKLYASAPLAERIAQAPAMMAVYLSMILLPYRLSVVHPPGEIFWFHLPWSIIALAAPLCLLILLWRAWRSDPVIAFGLLWFIVGMIPLLNIFPLAVRVLEHRLYVPLAGVTIALPRALALWFQGRRRSTLFGTAGAGILLVLAGLSFSRLQVWKNSETLWRDAIASSPKYSRSYFNLAGYYFERGEYNETVGMLRKYIALVPDDFLGYDKLRQTYFLAGDYDSAAQVCRLLIRRDPTNIHRYDDAAILYLRLGIADSAIDVYQGGLKINPGSYELHERLGDLYMKAGATEEAEREYRTALGIKPEDAAACFGIGRIEAARNRDSTAIRWIEAGLGAGVPSADILRLLDSLYVKSGEPGKSDELHRRYVF